MQLRSTYLLSGSSIPRSYGKSLSVHPFGIKITTVTWSSSTPKYQCPLRCNAFTCLPSIIEGTEVRACYCRLPQDLLAQAAEGSLRKLLQPSKRARASANGGPPRIADKAAAAKAPPARSAAQAAFQVGACCEEATNLCNAWTVYKVSPDLRQAYPADLLLQWQLFSRSVLAPSCGR